MKINRLRLLGFKSFVEPTDLVVEAGLTGVVGPNGCGKSNLLEALRWVMGETSHKSMRAAAMDDVIFSGTNTRPARNSAEVTLFLDNAERKAPAEFNDHDIIEITRRIEREAGSAYRINGKEARARDIKILFEDAATGARSPALVRQGQISEIVNAKPEQRRRVLEDAAGIAGLHSRRHEAELRLKAAENNLARLGDIMGGLSSQIESLKRQARQARRYKELSTDIRRTEALVFHLSWAEAQALVDQEEKNLADATTRLGLATEAESKALRAEAELAEHMPPLREVEAVKGAALGRLKIEQETFEKEAERARQRTIELTNRQTQLEKDIARETHAITEARDVLARLDKDLASLVEAENGAAAAEEKASAELTDIEQKLDAAEKALADITHRAAEQRARRRALETAVSERRETIARLEKQAASLEAQTREIQGRAPDVVLLQETTGRGQFLTERSANLERDIHEAEQQVTAAAEAANTHRDEAASARLLLSTLKTERETLAKLLIPVRDDDLPPIVDSISVTPGYEAALGAALGEDLTAPVADDTPVHWRLLHIDSTIDAALPQGVEPLSRYVDGPPELQRRLSQIGVVPQENGLDLQKHLAAGQRLVSVEGDLWRWDGYVAASGGATLAAQRLAERNRMAEIEERENLARAAASTLLNAEANAVEAHAAAQNVERTLRADWRKTQSDLNDTRNRLAVIEKQARETEAKLAAVNEAKERLAADFAEARKRLTETEAARDQEATSENLEPIANAAHETAQAARRSAGEARGKLQALRRERQLNTERQTSARADRDRWTTRQSGAEQQIKALDERLTETRAELETLADLPQKIAERRSAILSAISAAEADRQSAADKLAMADTALREAVQAMRAAQAQVSEAREGRARIEAKLENARARRQEEGRRIRETFEVAPEVCLSLAGVESGAALPALIEIDRQLQRLKGDRERLGGVNLQADDELTVLLEQITSMETEKADVEQAVAKLRAAIGQLNREGKKRLEEAFVTVNGHFQRLFTTLFGGGEARLEMVESEEDPLEGGLEIIAKPPGKKPATLSLLSGGEQTLTALSLIFAVFLTNPSPICVLDEVDAPLDDANVDRFCTLMEKMSTETATRFLVITHHPMTMARMNRLFGVTMSERGVSQLVSVDLETARSFREAV
ncbi:MAG: chromosome segregation protein SMC [Hyphomicrobium sp. 32-62-53]|nr:MAG: chromosome segregation protein SMC [Hyphomicrobium sp. 12-62-95]OYX99360.1 MAG: chromosome segregation protein SMC [Hyphomicrobium sp. 32-62-53]